MAEFIGKARKHLFIEFMRTNAEVSGITDGYR
jgi:hypothetical protein